MPRGRHEAFDAGTRAATARDHTSSKPCEAVRPLAALMVLATLVAGCTQPVEPPGPPATPRGEAPPTPDAAPPTPPAEPLAPTVRAVYVVAKNGLDDARVREPQITRSVEAFQQWLGAQTGGKRLPFARAPSGDLEVAVVRLTKTEPEMRALHAGVRAEIEAQLHNAGWSRSNASLYAVYYEGSVDTPCSAGAWPPEQPGDVAALYLHGGPAGAAPCEASPVGATTAPGNREFTMLKELLRTLGFAASCAPHQLRAGHVSDSASDLLYDGPAAWTPSALDVGRDDYYAHGRADCPDLATSRWLS